MVKKKGGNIAMHKQVHDLSEQELRELVLIQTYKLSLLRAQLETVTAILIKNKMTTYEEVWKETNDNLKDSA